MTIDEIAEERAAYLSGRSCGRNMATRKVATPAAARRNIVWSDMELST